MTVADINPNELYSPLEVAEMLGIHRDSVYAIPETDLKPTWVGPKRGRKKFRGSAITAYLDGEQS
jgi:hypothetical protein